MSTLRLFRLLLWVHWRSLLARLRGLRRRSPLLPALLAGFVVGYLLLGYFLFHRGLQFIYAFPAVGTLLSQRILYLIFGFFFVMLVFSNLIIGYSTLFKNRETTWFLTLPIRHADVYRWKFLEGVVVSSWALIFLSAPMMAAFGRVNEVGPAFYFQVALLYLPFVVIPAVLGAGIILGLVTVLAKPWAKKAGLALALAALSLVFLLVRPSDTDSINVPSEVRVFNQLLRHTHFSLNPFLPSAWMAHAVVSWSGGLGREGFFFFCLLLSNALMGLLLGFDFASHFFYESWTRAFGHRSERSQHRADTRRSARLRPGVIERLLDLRPVAALVSRPVRALVLKDVRVFWRDPAQWTQVMIFFGLLTIYVLNLRNVAYDFESPFWNTMISYLNLTACALTLSTLTTRFVFPQFSLEGRRLWIIGAGAVGPSAGAHAEILVVAPGSGQRHDGPHDHLDPDPAPGHGADRLFRGSHRVDERFVVRPSGGIGRVVSQLQGGQSFQDRQRLRRNALPGDEFRLHRALHFAAGVPGQFPVHLDHAGQRHGASSASLGCRQRTGLEHPGLGLAAGPGPAAAAAAGVLKFLPRSPFHVPTFFLLKEPCENAAFLA